MSLQDSSTAAVTQKKCRALHPILRKARDVLFSLTRYWKSAFISKEGQCKMTLGVPEQEKFILIVEEARNLKSGC